MENAIIIGIIVVLLVIGIRSSIKHLKGEGECCGGGGTTVKPKKKKLDTVVAKKIFIVDGMTCENCENRIIRAVNDIEGVACKVNLRKKEVTVSYEKEVADEVIRTAIEKMGYEIVEILRK